MHIQDGTPLSVLKEHGGWESMEMVMRYSHIAHFARTCIFPGIFLGGLEKNLEKTDLSCRVPAWIFCGGARDEPWRGVGDLVVWID